MTLLKSAAAAVVIAGWTVAAYAADSDAERPPRGETRANTFISPAGEPFRADPGQPYPVAVWFAQVDANHDGRITREELRADFDRFFKVLDANHDGVVDGFEVEDYERKIAPEVLSMIERPQAAPAQASETQDGEDQGGGRRGRGGGGGGGGGGPGGGGRGGFGGGGGNASENRQIMQLSAEGAAAYSLLAISEPVAAADMQLDGRITPAEFRAAADRRFDLLDTKQLGYLTLQTLPRTPAQIVLAKAKAKTQPAADKPKDN